MARAYETTARLIAQATCGHEDHAMRVTALGIHDEGVALEVVKLAGLELILAPDGEQRVGTVEDLSAVHLLCTVAADAAELVVGVAETDCRGRR